MAALTLLSKVSPGIFTPCTTVLVAEPQPLFRDAVTRAIRQRASLSLAGEPDDGHALLASIRRLQPDVAVLCPPLPGLDADGVLNAIHRDELVTRTVLMLPSLTPERAVASVARGAAACLSKDASGDQVCLAIEAAARGQAFFAPDIQTLLARGLRRRVPLDGPVPTAREREVLLLLADGLSRAAIAAALCLSEATVKTHLERLYRKLEVSDRAAAVATAMRRGWLE